MGVQKGVDRLLQFLNTTEDSAPNRFVCEFREESLDHIQPRRRGRCEVAVEPGMFGKPLFNLRRFMSLVVVQNQVDIQVLGRLTVDLAQEAQELVLPMAGQALANNAAVQNVQSGEQCGRTMPLVIMGHGSATPSELIWS